MKAPAAAPNVVIVLIDDIGFGHASTFGGPIQMPTLQSLADDGLRYNRFHTTALCSPTRTALLTGRNHHVNNAGAIMELATAFPGNTGVRPNSVAPLAEMLRLNGYSTAAFGKYHETAPWEASVSGPFDRWPTRSGFDKFYGFIGGETNQWSPAVYDGVTRVEVPHDPNYHFTTDMTNQAIAWMRFQQALTPDKPFFIYFATGATHAPHHVPKEWIAKYKGQFDQGWDKLREETLARQLKLGVVPAGTRLTPRPAEIPAWDSLTADQKRLFARQMETFAGFGEHTDHEVGRLVQALRDMGELENTLFLYIVGDNGVERRRRAGRQLQRDPGAERDRERRRPRSWRTSTSGAGRTRSRTSPSAGRTPATRPSSGPSRWRRTSGARAIRWSSTGRSAFKAKGGLRSQFHHVIDVAPDGARSGRAAAAEIGQRHDAAADGRGLDAVHVRRPHGQGPPHHAVLRDVRQPRHLPRRLGRGHAALDPVADGPRSFRRSTRTAGSSTTSTRTSARPKTSPRRIPPS